MCRERPNELGKYLVLNVFVRIPVPAFQFNTNGKVITTRPVLEPGCTRMPGPEVQGHVLGQAAVAPDEDVGGDPQPGAGPEIRVGIGVERVREQPIDVLPP